LGCCNADGRKFHFFAVLAEVFVEDVQLPLVAVAPDDDDDNNNNDMTVCFVGVIVAVVVK
jgi:hypothetical protein